MPALPISFIVRFIKDNYATKVFCFILTVSYFATKTEQLEETLKSTEILHKLTPDVMEHIETILQNKPQHPLY
jgi:hypothetical protein